MTFLRLARSIALLALTYSSAAAAKYNFPVSGMGEGIDVVIIGQRRENGGLAPKYDVQTSDARQALAIRGSSRP